jgi:hypothetical protein
VTSRLRLQERQITDLARATEGPLQSTNNTAQSRVSLHCSPIGCTETDLGAQSHLAVLQVVSDGDVGGGAQNAEW